MSDNISSQSVSSTENFIKSFDFTPEYNPVSKESRDIFTAFDTNDSPSKTLGSPRVFRKQDVISASFSASNQGVEINLNRINRRSFSDNPIRVLLGNETAEGDNDDFNNLKAFHGVGSQYNDKFGEDYVPVGGSSHNFHSRFFAGAGNDEVYGGNGDDQLHGGSGNDVIKGGLGNDYIIPGSGLDFLDGGQGKDALLLNYESSLTSVIILSQQEIVEEIKDRQTEIKAVDIGTTSQGDTFRNIELIYAVTGQGNDIIDATGKDSTFNIDLYNNKIVGSSKIAYFASLGAGNDIAKTTSGDDVIDAGSGNDTINTGTGRDIIYGGDGDDIIRTEDTGDSIHGGAGNDVIFSAVAVDGGNTSLFGGAGADTFVIDVLDEATTTYAFNTNLEAFARFASGIIDAMKPQNEGPNGTKIGVDLAFAVASGLAGSVPVVGSLVGIGVDAAAIGVNTYLDADERSKEIKRINRNATAFSSSLVKSSMEFGELEVNIKNRDKVVIEDFEIGVDHVVLPSLDKLNRESKLYKYEYVIREGDTKQGLSAFVHLVGDAKPGSGQKDSDDVVLEIRADNYFNEAFVGNRPSFFETIQGLHYNGMIGTFNKTPILQDSGTGLGTNAHDVVRGGRGHEKLSGWLGDDIIQGGAGNDVLYGGFGELSGRLMQLGLWSPNDGDDKLLGEEGDDALYGEGGNDYLEGGAGSDVSTGGAGADTFVLDAQGGVDRITDFNAQEGDRIAFKAYFDLNQFVYDQSTGNLSYGGRTVGVLENRPSNFSPQAHIQLPKVGAFTLAQQTAYNQLKGRSAPAFAAVEIGGLSVPHLFDEAFYLSKNADVAVAVRGGALPSGYDHFINYGWVEGRNPSAFYDEAFYLAENSDVAAAVSQRVVQSGLQHFMLYGHQENRAASKSFDAADYLAANADVKNAVNQGSFRSAFEHYVEFGAAEGRAAGLIFDESYYREVHPNAVKAMSGLEHYARYGQSSGHGPNALFNEGLYLAANADVKNAVGQGYFASGFDHYANFGRFEAGRVIG
ncbi:calcium-binding protein [Pseudanabaena sp. FACHB-2040]|uniref:calcium-binding protein n=1 Tax=Pseudanabaena sp. FACHB-2040 TaxID=2692859 RepID=UPI001684921E|nr:calcium-binding protein [Pseudanabaena sp. FACHB-2040]MBD2258297.1 hypothetical protein [Pseudanabaena sp. FACHB-2040]